MHKISKRIITICISPQIMKYTIYMWMDLELLWFCVSPISLKGCQLSMLGVLILFVL